MEKSLNSKSSLGYDKKNTNSTITKNLEKLGQKLLFYFADPELNQLAVEFLAERADFIDSKSISQYQSNFSSYSFLKLSDFERPHFTKFLLSHAKPVWSKATTANKIILLTAFGNWLCGKHLVQQRFHFSKIRTPRIKPVPSSLELELLFDSLHNDYLNSSDKMRFTKHQTYLICKVLFETGARISEVLAIYLDDVRMTATSKQIFIDGTKTESSKRTVRISEKLFSELNHFRNEYELEGRLFSTRTGRLISSSYFGETLSAYCEKLGFEERITPHTFRYLFIIESIRQGKDALEIMTRLGHSSVDMTIYYFNQVRRLYPEAELSASISILEKKKGYNTKIYGKTKLYG